MILIFKKWMFFRRCPLNVKCNMNGPSVKHEKSYPHLTQKIKEQDRVFVRIKR